MARAEQLGEDLKAKWQHAIEVQGFPAGAAEQLGILGAQPKGHDQQGGVVAAAQQWVDAARVRCALGCLARHMPSA